MSPITTSQIIMCTIGMGFAIAIAVWAIKTEIDDKKDYQNRLRQLENN